MLIAAIAGIMIAGTIAVAMPTAAFAKDKDPNGGGQTANGGIGGAGGAGGVGGPGGTNIGAKNGINYQKDNANGGNANGGDGGDANGGHATCSKFVFHC